MPLEISCKKCQATFKVSQRLSGKRLKCRKCAAPITVPAATANSGQRRKRSRAASPAGDAVESDGELDFALLSKLESRGQALGSGDLIECSQCGDVYGSESDACVHCGAPNDMKKRRAKAKARKSRKRVKETTIFQGLGEFFYEYDALLRPLGFVCLFLALCGGVIYLIDVGSSVPVPGREQKEFGNRTTTKWIELEQEGKARRVEVLWQDQRWIPLEQFLGLDWAAVPEWFRALTDDRSRRLAEDVLGKYHQTMGGPYLDDLQAGLDHQDRLVRLWAARLASKLEGDFDKVAPVLETMAKDSDEELSKAALDALAKFKSDEG